MPKVRCEKCGKTFESGNDGFLAKTFSSTKIALECEECQERQLAAKTLEVKIKALSMAVDHDVKIKSLVSEKEIKKESLANERHLEELKIKKIDEMHKRKVDAAHSIEKDRIRLMRSVEESRSAIASTIPQEKKTPSEVMKLFPGDSAYNSSGFYEALKKVPRRDHCLETNDSESK